MSHQIVECPGCLTKLRVREATQTIQLQCPRCGELLAIDPPEPAPKPAPAAASIPAPVKNRPAASSIPAPAPTPPKKPTQPAAPAASSRPKPSSQPAPSRPARKPAKKETADYDDPWNTDSSDSDETYEEAPAPRRRTAGSQNKKQGNGLVVGLLAGGGVALVGVLIFAIISFTKSSGSGGNVANSVAAGSPAGTLPPADLTGTIPGFTPPDSATGVAAAPMTPSGSPFNPNASPGSGNMPPATAAISGDSRRLRYHWKPGAEYMYQFTVEEGSGDEVRKTTGVCAYRVQGDSGRVETEEEGTGTGFVVSPDGIIATCAHVVEGAKRMEVHLNGQIYPATVIAVDPKADVALVRINATGLSALVLSDSDAVQLAESVRAIGYPLSDVLGTDVKVTTGTVAGIVQNRDRGKQIQIDAAINPGNSGGPVVNGAGQVVGVASAKLSGSSVTSVGFAAPVNQLRALASANGLQLPISPRSQDLAGPEVGAASDSGSGLHQSVGQQRRPHV